jgi:two-component system, LuxR family, response regulator FixJ
VKHLLAFDGVKANTYLCEYASPLGSEPTAMLQNNALNGEIFIVDDDALVRETMSIVFGQAGYQVMTFCDGMSFVAAARMRIPACVLMDICMPGPSGLEILKQLDAANYPAPILIVSGRGDIPIAVQAMKNGAYDFIEKQLDFSSIVERARKTIDTWARRQQMDGMSDIRWRHFPGRLRLTRREVEVLAQVVAGASNKAAAKNLGVSPRTIEVHRRHIMKKLGAKNAADLVRTVLNSNGSALQHGGSHTEHIGSCD